MAREDTEDTEEIQKAIDHQEIKAQKKKPDELRLDALAFLWCLGGSLSIFYFVRSASMSSAGG